MQSQYITPKNMTLFMVLAALVLWIYLSLPKPLPDMGDMPLPTQKELKKPLQLKAPDGFQITATDEYTQEALIVSTARYRMGKESQLSPVDFALAWGPLTRKKYLDHIKFSQNGRWYYYQYDGDASNLSLDFIRDNSANTHIVPEPDNVILRDFILGLKKGETVRLKGYLVRITAKDGWHWNSSRTRNDSGDHSCELMYVTEGELISPPASR